MHEAALDSVHTRVQPTEAGRSSPIPRAVSNTTVSVSAMAGMTVLGKITRTSAGTGTWTGPACPPAGGVGSVTSTASCSLVTLPLTITVGVQN